MAREEQYKGYYNEILTNKSYIDTRLSIQTAIADFLVQTFFGKDFDRVIYTNPEYAFRRRLERLANGVKENLFLTDLKLPFCSFYVNGAPEIIKTAASSEWRGYYDESIEQRVHFINTLQKWTVQFFFDRSDDASIAFDIAQRESLAEYPIRYIQEVFWRNITLEQPIWITVKKVTSGNESFNESEWLEKNHLFALTLDLEVEVAKIHIHKGLNAVQLPFKWHSTGNRDTWEDGQPSYYTQKCVLMWANKALKFDVTPPDEPTEDAKNLYDSILKNPQLVPADNMTLRQIQSVLPNGSTAEIIEGFFQDTTRITFNRLAFNEEKTEITDKGEVYAWIDFLVKPSTYSYWDYTEYIIPGRKGKAWDMTDPKNPIELKVNEKGVIIIKNCKVKAIKIEGLHPNSKYESYFIARDINGNFNTIPLSFTTPVWGKETLPDVTPKDDKGNNKDTVEMSEIKTEDLVNNIEDVKNSEEPKVVRMNGLIGLEL